MAGRPRLTEEDFEKRKMGSNPFTEDLRIKVLQIRTEHELVGVRKDEEVSVEVTNEASILNRFYAEVQNFTKVFQSPVHRKALGGLPARAKELVLWIAFELKPKKDFVVINIERYKKENRCSHSTYTRAVADLVGARIIMPTMWQSVFWVNPAFMFNGNRISKYKDNLTVFEKRDKGKVVKKPAVRKETVLN